MPTPLAGSEVGRKVLHLAGGTLAFPLRWMTWWQGALMAGAAAAVNAFLLPRLRVGVRIARPGEPFLSGIAIYPVAVLLLLLIFPMPAAAAAWTAMAAGDACSNLAGRRWGRARLPWNSQKSWVGLAAFFLAAAPAALAALLWTAASDQTLQPGALGVGLVPALAAAAAGAALESLPSPVNDNWTVPLGCGLTLHLLAPACAMSLGPPPPLYAQALGVNAALAAIGHALGWISPSGVAAGCAFGFVFTLSMGWPAFAALALFVASGSLATRWRYPEKMELGLAQEHGGRRSARHAVKIVPALVCAVLHLAEPSPAFRVAYAAALAAALADTVATELGQLYGRRTVTIPFLRAVPRGTEGGISLEGSALGILAATLLALVSLASGLLDKAWSAGLVVGAAFLGNSLESLLAPWSRRLGHRRGDWLNLVHTAAAAAFAGMAA
ncbi:MAG: DUF92 domain-containing protein [Planctomycetes bacterium]|nr:DUF92 domain-containing protein [Planctomycetota bacterium]